MTPPTATPFHDVPPAITQTASAANRDRSIAVCIPARNEEHTIGSIVDAAIQNRTRGLIEHVIVIDDGSRDRTAALARAAGADVISTPPEGKGQALRTALARTTSDLVVFVDADLTSFDAWHIPALVLPLLLDDTTMLVKPRYERSLHGRPGEGGRVNELVARPLLRLHWPELAHLSQPLAGECAIRRTALENVEIAAGYAIELALLLDIAHLHGSGSITEVDLGVRSHRNRPLRDLSHQATEILAEALHRIPAGIGIVTS